MFYSETMMHRIYIDSGAFDFIYQLPEIIYSAIITAVINTINTNLELRKNNNKKNLERKNRQNN